MKYIIFENELELDDGKIISWAPKRTNKFSNGFPWWREVANIKKFDTIYFISNTNLVAIGEAIDDAKSYKHQQLYNSSKANSNWSDEGYGVISRVTHDYSNFNISLTKELEKSINSIGNIKPFEVVNGKVKAHQGGYCYPLSLELENIINNIISSYKKSSLKDFTEGTFSYNPISLNSISKKYGTSLISSKKINKGRDGELKVQDFFDKLGYNCENVAESVNHVADLVITNKNKKYSLEIKNISNQNNTHYIYLSDNQIRALILGDTRLCLYFEGDIYLSSNACKTTFFKEIIEATNQCRKYVVDHFEGKYFATELAILINKKIVEQYFVLINNLNKSELNKLFFD